MLKSLLVIPALLFGAAPAQAYWVWVQPHAPRQIKRVICDPWGCHVRLRQPRLRLHNNCVYKPWKQKTVCKY